MTVVELGLINKEFQQFLQGLVKDDDVYEFVLNSNVKVDAKRLNALFERKL